MVTSCSDNTFGQWEFRKILFPIEGPIPARKTSSQHHVTKVIDKAEEPEKTKKVVQMEP